MRRLAATALLLATLLLPGEAGAIGMSAGTEALPQGMTQQQCFSVAEAALRQAGLRVLEPTTNARWGQNDASDEMYMIFCSADRGIAFVSGAAARTEQADASVIRLLDLFQAGLAGRPGR